MRIILSGGGTGGHIYPAVTIGREIAGMATGCEFLFIGTKQGLEADIIPREGFPFATIEVRGLERRLLSWNNLRTLGVTATGLWRAAQMIRRFRPQLVIGTGGYVCGPVLLAASLLGVSTLIQEQNVIPGITNKLLSRVVDRIAVGYEEARQYFPARVRGKIVATGNPVRPEFLAASRQEGLADLQLDPGKMTLLVVGGSRGAQSINRAMVDVHRHFAGNTQLQILHVTGKNEYNSIVEAVQARGVDIAAAGNLRIEPYLYNMPQALSAADLAIFRSGAVGLAELTVRGVPAILIPYPHAAENHQEHNARAVEARGAARVIRDRDLSGTVLCEAITTLVYHPEQLQAMARASKNLGRPEAARDIAREALALVDR
ncbi:MAG TPA: undecaprenyldiphospho-muramoylpentapeptide beta-N-acetylglucosaminyltransferase [Patescibacteria group bacterium]|nr:undecaprenyldiphospho-muramoylpentapeptide beta-N-acetylglucosaminyltransferase [Patescibacteria group bacterium]